MRPPFETFLHRRWPWLIKLFSAYVRRYLARHFHAIRVSRGTLPGDLPTGPLVIALTHPSWWDPLVGLLLAEKLPKRLHAVPMDEVALGSYRFFEHLGFFGIGPGGPGLRRLLRLTDSLMKRDDAVLWITPQGRIQDAAVRPLGLKPGIGHVLSRMDRGFVLPVALDYRFWTERLPEALLRVAPLIPISAGAGRSPEAWTELIEQALTSAQDELGRDASTRDPSRFDLLLSGRAGVGRIYDGWRALWARLTGRRFSAAHGDLLRDHQPRQTLP